MAYVKFHTKLDYDMKDVELAIKQRNKMQENREINKRAFVSHLLNNKWQVNYNYIEREAKKKKKEVNIDSDVWGKFDKDYHLISPCQKYTVKISAFHAHFWQKDPEWLLLVEQEFQRFELIDGGIKIGPMKITLE